MIGYKYITVSEALEAMQMLNNHFGFPLGKTQNFASYIEVEDFYVIIHSEEMEPVLGEPIEIITNNQP